jgi:rhodanese-related sulfurtransferase
MKYPALFLCMLAMQLPFAACSPKTDSVADDFGRIISYAELTEWLGDAQKQTIIVDIRRNDEVALGMIPGAVHIPLADLDKRIQELPKDARIVLYCRSGNRVQSALPIFKENGYTRVYNFVAFDNWKGDIEYPL